MNPSSNKRWRLSVIAALTAVLNSCTVMYEAPDLVAKIQPGASKVQVSAALGAPARIVTAGDREAWLYCRESAVLDRFVLAVFNGSTLKSVSQNMDFEFGACAQSFERFTLAGPGS